MSPIFAARRVRGSAKRTPAHIRKKSDKGDIFALCLDLMRSLATLCVAFLADKAMLCRPSGFRSLFGRCPFPCLPLFLAVLGSLVKGAGVEPAFLCSAVVPPLVVACGLSRPLALHGGRFPVRVVFVVSFIFVSPFLLGFFYVFNRHTVNDNLIQSLYAV